MATTTSREHRRLFKKAACAALGGFALVGGLVAAVTTGETAIDTVAVGVPVLSPAPALDTRTFTADEAAIGFYLPGTVGLRFIVR